MDAECSVERDQLTFDPVAFLAMPSAAATRGFVRSLFTLLREG
jgi:hypothetical protein